jgi:hypothetical protein
MASSTDRPVALRARQALDALAYAVAWVLAVIAVAAVVSLPFGGVLVGVKFVLFFVGFFVFGVSAFQLRPTPPWKGGEDESSGEREDTPFEGLVRRAPLLERNVLASDERLPPPAKLFVASVLALCVSLVLEVGFDVAA